MAKPGGIAQQLKEQFETGETPRFIPPGRHGLGRDQVTASQRMRIAEGVMASVARKGYYATTIKDIIADAHVSKKTFYELFENKEHAFAAAYVELGSGVNEAVAGAAAASESWTEALTASVGAFLEYFASHGDFAQVWATHTMTASERILEMVLVGDEVYLRILKALHAAMREEIATLPEADDDTIWALVGAIAEVLRLRIRSRGAASVTDLQPLVVGLICLTLGAPTPVSTLTPTGVVELHELLAERG